jgi:hypothetical protein
MSRTSPETETLKPCPFCGSEAKKSASGETYKIHCSNEDGCTATTRSWWNEQNVTAAWNRRAGLAQKPKQWPEPKVTNPDIASPTGVPYIDCLIHRVLDAQQDINHHANEGMSQSLCDAAALLDEVETTLRTAVSDTSTDRVGLLDPGIDGPYNEPCRHFSVHDGPRVEARWGTVPTQICDCGMWRTMHHTPGHWQAGPVSSPEGNTK